SQRVAVPATGDEVAVLASAFNHMATSLEETRRLRRAQTADIAHELRTPLTSVRGYLEAIQDGAVAATSAVIASMHEEVLLLDGLMSDLQDLALAEAGQLSLHRTSHSLEPLLERAAAMQAVAARARGITLRVLPSVAPLPPMAVDAPRLSQVLRNLIANSLVHTPAGGSVALSVRGEGNWVDILVCDTGRGIAPEHLPHLFERFYRADPSRDRATGGAGIGLSVARGIVQAHGGTITVSSVVDQGTDFHIRLPREARPSDRDASYDASR
ncbi:MAG TPA: HAMP domain-containing sensor histidine kinase, partial [Chloroflexota bacterium]|nr:HAMP domain-containing sensor histidine kinase [Chloroflexota bacterium]